MIRVLIPTYHRLSELIDCLDSVANQIRKEQLDSDSFHVHIVDNGSDDDVKDRLTAFALDHQGIVSLNLLPENIGKAKALNSLSGEIADSDVVVSLDSDIVIKEPDTFFRTGAELVTSLVVSAIASNQVGNNHHKTKRLWSQLDGGHFHVKRESFGQGIAGGCLFTRGSVWHKVGGYREDRGLFGGNDGWFFWDAGHIEGAPVAIVKELVIYHPPDYDKAYRAWKNDAQKQQVSHNRCLLENGYFD